MRLPSINLSRLDHAVLYGAKSSILNWLCNVTSFYSNYNDIRLRWVKCNYHCFKRHLSDVCYLDDKGWANEEYSEQHNTHRLVVSSNFLSGFLAILIAVAFNIADSRFALIISCLPASKINCRTYRRLCNIDCCEILELCRSRLRRPIDLAALHLPESPSKWLATFCVIEKLMTATGLHNNSRDSYPMLL